MSIHKICFSFGDLRWAAYQSFNKDISLFERVFIKEKSRVKQQALLYYGEDDWKLSLPEKYPVVLFARLYNPEDTNIDSSKRLFVWDWTYLDVAMRSEDLETIRLALLDRKASVEVLAETRPVFRGALLDVRNLFNKLFPKG